MNTNLKNKFIKIILENGVDFKEQDNILIVSDVENSEFARDILKYAFNAGANDVDIIWTDEKLRENDYKKSFNNISNSWKKSRNEYYKQEKYKMIWIYNNSSDFKDNIDLSIETENLPFIQTTVINAPNKAWEDFLVKEGELNNGELWDKILTACRVDEKSNYKEHLQKLENIKNQLNNLNLSKIIIKNKLGTNIEMELVEEHIWTTCITNKNGELRVSNIPTEEVFTTPKKYSVNGTVVLTRPIIYNGKKIDKVKLEFKAGKIIKYSSGTNQKTLKNIIEENKNMKYIGEIGLVFCDSPLSNLNMNWYDTSFDENMSVHIALGNSYANTVKDGYLKTREEQEKIGMNIAEMHIDLTIGDNETSVIGITANNEKVLIIENGVWSSNILN